MESQNQGPAASPWSFAHPFIASSPRLPRLDSSRSPSTTRRFAGDGLDHRRPAAASHADADADAEASPDTAAHDDDLAIDLSREDDVIDLTADDSGYGDSQDGNGAGTQGRTRSEQPQPFPDRSRGLPRGMDIIIDLDNGEEEWMVEGAQLQEPESPDIEFISSRQLPPNRQNAPRFRRRPSDGDGDDVEFVRENTLPHEEMLRRRNQELDHVMDLLGTMNGRFTHLRAQVDRFNAQVNRTADRFRRGPVPPARSHAQVRLGFMAPALDFNAVAFDMGLPGGRAAEPPAITYQAPPAAPDGFTRNPADDEVLVCPNCGDELCCGPDEVKKQVWVVKNCGHVYCGECTANRSSRRSAKGKERPANSKPFKECQVEGCAKSVANRKAMIQVFL